MPNLLGKIDDPLLQRLGHLRLSADVGQISDHEGCTSDQFGQEQNPRMSAFVERGASTQLSRTAGFGVRREKAALSSGCEAHPAKSLQPEAIGAVMEVTKWLKPSISGHNW